MVAHAAVPPSPADMLRNAGGTYQCHENNPEPKNQDKLLAGRVRVPSAGDRQPPQAAPAGRVQVPVQLHPRRAQITKKFNAGPNSAAASQRAFRVLETAKTLE